MDWQPIRTAPKDGRVTVQWEPRAATTCVEEARAKKAPHEGHTWEAGTWGVIIGVSRCLLCGITSRAEHFVATREAAP